MRCQRQNKISLAGLGNRARREINRRFSMSITSHQKKTALPLAVFVISTALYFWGLGSIFVLFCVPFMAVSAGVLAASLLPAITGWFQRDGWK
jgi:hypothetical protein